MPSTWQVGQSMYESGVLKKVTHGPLRPGGTAVTQILLDGCGTQPDDLVVDVGCGEGYSINRIRGNSARLKLGMDSYFSLLMSGKRSNPDSKLVCADGFQLPISDNSVDTLIGECSFTASANFGGLLKECFRVLCPGGRLGISDVYVRDPDNAASLREIPLLSCIGNALDMGSIQALLQAAGFEVIDWQDRSEYLRDLACQINGCQGSAAGFWQEAEPQSDPFEIIIAISRAKLGYFTLIAEKIGVFHG